jgi:hypothetical protein
VSDENGQNNNEGDAVLIFNDFDGLQKAEMGRDVAVRPARHKKRRGDGVDALTCNVGSLHMELMCILKKSDTAYSRMNLFKVGQG